MGSCYRCLTTVLLGVVFILPASAAQYEAGAAEFRPFAYADENGQLEGISIDVGRRVMQMAGIDVAFNTYPVNRLELMLKKGEIDINYADSLQWNRPKDLYRYVFSEPYAVVEEHLYFLADNPGREKPIEQLDGLIIGVIRGYNYKVLEQPFSSHRLNRLETSKDEALLMLLQTKRVDAVAIVDDAFELLIANNHLDANAFRQGALLNEAPLVFKLQPKHAQWLPRINQAIQVLGESGELDHIRRHYLPADNRPSCTWPGQAC